MEKQLEELKKNNNSGNEKETSEKFTIMEEKLETILKTFEERNDNIHQLENKLTSIEEMFNKKTTDL